MSGSERSDIAERLYLAGGTENAARRCDLNTRFGQLNLGAELVRKTRLARGHSIADVGCGTGEHLETGPWRRNRARSRSRRRLSEIQAATGMRR